MPGCGLCAMAEPPEHAHVLNATTMEFERAVLTETFPMDVNSAFIRNITANTPAPEYPAQYTAPEYVALMFGVPSEYIEAPTEQALADELRTATTADHDPMKCPTCLNLGARRLMAAVEQQESCPRHGSTSTRWLRWLRRCHC